MPELSLCKDSRVSNPMEAADYGEILQYMGASYVVNDYYLQVGQIQGVQGWILHLTSVIHDVPLLLKAVVPSLLEEGVAFKVVMNRETARNLLFGQLGIVQVGKLICIYPPSRQDAERIATKCIALTHDLKGPVVPTDAYLGGVVYTRYGGFNPVIQTDDKGRKIKYIYGPKGSLIKDPITIPFSLPENVSWPFNTMGQPVIPAQKTTLQKKFRLEECLKLDIRGSVYKGIYVKGFLQTGRCVIKQGVMHMASEDSGRDIKDRLAWQFYLHRELAAMLPVPKAIEFFEEDGHSYLVLEFIEGITLIDHLNVINFNHKAWKALRASEKRLLLGYLRQVIDIISKLHSLGYVHRDIQPGNFIMHRNGAIYLIDLELTWSLRQEIPDPPFALGTPGYTSPEQARIEKPTLKEDIYGLGGLMLTLFTGMSPLKFDTSDAALSSRINGFIGHERLARLITACLSSEPGLRPAINTISTLVNALAGELAGQGDTPPMPFKNQDGPYNESLQAVLLEAVQGLTEAPIIMSGDHWLSKFHHDLTSGVSGNKEFTRYPGMLEGMSGILYLIAKLQHVGSIPLTPKARAAYDACICYLTKEYIAPGTTPAGLYYGSYGIAVSLAWGIAAGLISPSAQNLEHIVSCFRQNIGGMDVASGMAGKGIALLQCQKYLEETTWQTLLKDCIDQLVLSQKKDGSWTTEANPFSFAGGVPGITWFLFEHSRRYHDSAGEHAAMKGLQYILKQTHQLQDLFDGKAFERLVQQGRPAGDERTGVLLAALKGQETCPDTMLRKAIELTLQQYPFAVASNNFSQLSGLAGLGELYMEAYSILGAAEWKDRAAWVAELFIQLRWCREGSCSWKADENDYQTADLLIGTGGIIHFLARMADPVGFGYCLIE